MRKEEKINKTEEIKKIVITFLLFFVFPIAYQLAFYIVLTKCNNIIKSIILLGGEVLLTVALVAIYKDIFKNCWNDFKKNKKEYSDLMIKSWVLGFIIMLVSNLFINVVLNNGMAANESANRSIMKSLAIYAIPSIMLLGPICEELTFRVSFKKIFKKNITYILITSLLFAGVHIYRDISSIKDVLYIVPYGSLGVAMSYVYSKTDNVLTNIIMHIFHNSLSVALLLLAL